MTLSKLAAVTTDELGNETFDASGALDKLRKVITYLKIIHTFLGVYIDKMEIEFL